MCIAPIKIKNPNFGFRGSVDFMRIHDCHSQYIEVPCQQCPDCVRTRQNGYVQRAQIEGFDHIPFFCTLTYNRKYLPKYEFANGDIVPFARVRDVQDFIRELRRNGVFGGRDFRYMAVSEFGSKKHRPHWHILFFVKSQSSDSIYTGPNFGFTEYSKILDAWHENIGTRKNPIYEPRLDIKYSSSGESTFDFHYVENRANSEDVYFYITKYALKFDKYTRRLKSALMINHPDEFSEAWKQIRPHFLLSKGFGSLDSLKKFEYFESCISRSDDFPCFFNPVTGFQSPLARYLKKYLSDEQRLRFAKPYFDPWSFQVLPMPSHIVLKDPVDPSRVSVVNHRFSRIVDKLNEPDFIDIPFNPDDIPPLNNNDLPVSHEFDFDDPSYPADFYPDMFNPDTFS